MPPKRITTVKQLQKLCQKENGLECFILLNGGMRSSKTISYDLDGLFYVFNEIDGSDDEFTEQQLINSFIGEALKGKALFAY